MRGNSIPLPSYLSDFFSFLSGIFGQYNRIFEIRLELSSKV